MKLHKHVYIDGINIDVFNVFFDANINLYTTKKNISERAKEIPITKLVGLVGDLVSARNWPDDRQQGKGEDSPGAGGLCQRNFRLRHQASSERSGVGLAN